MVRDREAEGKEALADFPPGTEIYCSPEDILLQIKLEMDLEGFGACADMQLFSGNSCGTFLKNRFLQAQGEFSEKRKKLDSFTSKESY